jgi:hypothetical protein
VEISRGRQAFGSGNWPGEVDVSGQVSPPDRRRAAINATAAGLREVAGRQLYRSNAFRIAGLPTDADRKTVRQRQRQVVPALEAGVDVDLGHRLPVGLEEVRAAFDRLLNDPHRRLVDELFWLWGSSNADCGCTAAVHDNHDAAVRAHSAALDLDAKGEDLTDEELDEAERLWSTAGKMWGKVLSRAAFWDHVRARITALDERQLDESVIDVLREQVPLTLLKPLIELATETSDESGWLADQARHWPAVPQHVIGEQLEQAAAPFYDAARNATNKAATTLYDGQPEQAASAVYQEVVPQLRRLEELVPHHRHRRTARARDDAALMLNNCATVLIERIGPRSQQQASKWLGTARDLASDSHALQTIDANKATLDEMVTAFEMIEKRVSELVALHHHDLAREMLLDVKLQMQGGVGTAEIDRMLAELGGRQSRVGGPVTANRVITANIGRRRAALVLLLAAIAGVVYLFWSNGADAATSFSERIEENAPAGQCIATRDGWNGDQYKAEVPVVDCDQPHWAEIFGYPELYQPTSPQPGDDAVAQTACRRAATERALPAGYRVIAYQPGKDSTESTRAVCLASRADDQTFSGRIQ